MRINPSILKDFHDGGKCKKGACQNTYWKLHVSTPIVDVNLLDVLSCSAQKYIYNFLSGKNVISEYASTFSHAFSSQNRRTKFVENKSREIG